MHIAYPPNMEAADGIGSLLGGSWVKVHPRDSISLYATKETSCKKCSSEIPMKGWDFGSAGNWLGNPLFTAALDDFLGRHVGAC